LNLSRNYCHFDFISNLPKNVFEKQIFKIKQFSTDFLKELLLSDSNSRPYITLETITNNIRMTVSVEHKSQIEGELPWNAIKNLSNKIALSGNVENEVYCFVKIKAHYRYTIENDCRTLPKLIFGSTQDFS